jgi:sugar lactone lactonase YvrE
MEAGSRGHSLKLMNLGLACRPRVVTVAILATLVGVLGLHVPSLHGQAPPPDARWMTFETPHFQVVFHEGLEDMAFQAAARAERALDRLSGFGTRPPERIQLVLTDHVDLSNGFARAAPYPRIVIWARPPVTGPGAIPFDDWLELVVTHEVVHILHLEMTGTPGRVARRLVGRAPVAWPLFPAFTLPSWAVEGVAVQAESDLTDGGRMHGARFDAILRARVLTGQGERIDQVMGTSPVFPGGERPYAWGGPFFHHLAEVEGEEAVGAFFRRSAERLNPYRFNASAREAFGASLEELHEEWLRTLEAGARVLEAEVRARRLAPEPERLTTGTRLGLYPAFRPDDGAMAWVRSDGRSEMAVVLREPGEGRGVPESGGYPAGPVPDRGPDRVILPLHQAAPLAWGPGGTLWTAQPDFVDRFTIRSDVWRIDPDGRRHRVTQGMRVGGLDVHPGSGSIVAVLEVPGTNHLAILSPDGRLVASLTDPDPGIHWAHPRWSPDGTRVAVTRWRAGGSWAVGVLEVTSGASPPRFRVIDEGRAPIHGSAWTPDSRRIVWSSERSGVANLYVAPADPVPGTGGQLPGPPPEPFPGPLTGQISDLVTAGIFPTVTPSGTHVVFSLLAADGWDLARLPLGPGETTAAGDTSRWGAPPLPLAPRHLPPVQAAMTEGHRARVDAQVRPWSPASTLRPRHWIPMVQSASTLGGARVLAPTLGFESWAADAVDRHRWDLRLDLPVGGPGRRWEGTGSWQWAGLGNPVFTAGVSQLWDPLAPIAPPADGEGGETRPLYLVARERNAALAASFLRPGFRESRQAVLDLRHIRQDLHLLEAGGAVSTRARLARPERDLLQVAAILSRSTIRSHAFHPSAQEGSQVTLRLRTRRELSLADTARGVPGRDASFQDVILSARHFRSVGSRGLPASGGAPPALGVRGALGVAQGPGAGASTLRIGGGGGGGSGPLGATWDRAPGVFQVRGFEAGAGGGARAWGAGVELRLPLAIVHRGVGILPVHADRVAATLWMDAAGASGGHNRIPGDVARLATDDLLLSAGAEAAVVHALLFRSQALLRAGVAVPVEGAAVRGAGRPGPSVYAGLGWAF